MQTRFRSKHAVLAISVTLILVVSWHLMNQPTGLPQKQGTRLADVQNNDLTEGVQALTEDQEVEGSLGTQRIAFVPVEYIVRVRLAGKIPLRNQAVAVEDETGANARVIRTNSDGELRFTTASRQATVVLRPKFLRTEESVSINVPEGLLSPVDLGDVSFGSALSGIVLEIECADRGNVSTLTGGVRFPQGRRLTSAEPHRVSVRLRNGRAQAVFELPPGQESIAYVQIPNLYSEEADAYTAMPKEWVVQRISLCDLSVITPIIEGVPDAPGRVLMLSRSSRPLIPERFSNIDSESRAPILGRFDDRDYSGNPWTASIGTADGVLVRLIAEDGKDVITSRTDRLRAREELVGLAILNDAGEIDRVSEWRVTLGEERVSFLDTLQQGVQLFLRETLDKYAYLSVQTRTEEWSNIPIVDLVPGSDGVLGIRRHPGILFGALRVQCSNGEGKKWSLVGEATSGARYEARIGSREPLVYELDGLLPGRYDLYWSWEPGGSGVFAQPFVSDVVVEAGEATLLTANVPEVQKRVGYFVNWEQRADWCQPLMVRFGTGPVAHVDAGGQFTLEVAEPLTLPGDVMVRGRVGPIRGVVDIVEDSSDAFVVRLRQEGVVPLLVPVSLGQDRGNGDVEFWIVNGDRPEVMESPFGELQRWTAQSGPVVVACRADEVAIGIIKDQISGVWAPFEIYPGGTPRKALDTVGTLVTVMASSADSDLGSNTKVLAVWKSSTGHEIQIPLDLGSTDSDLWFWCPSDVHEVEIRRGNDKSRQSVRVGEPLIIRE